MRPNNGHSHDGDEKTFDLRPGSDTQSGDDIDSRRSTEEAQAGVRRIEAVSKSWTLTSLILAYVTYVFWLVHCLLFSSKGSDLRLDLCS